MKRNIISIAAAGVLATAISVLAAGSPAAFAAPFNGVSGEGYQCESGSRDPDPIPYNDSGSMRAIAQNNTVNPELTDGISRFSYRVFLPLLRDSRENMNFSPVSLYYALAQASEGAEGNTRAQMLALMGIGSQTPDGSQSPEPAQALHTAQPPAGLAASCGRLYRQIFRNNEKTKLKLVNSMWLKEGAPLNDSFKRTSENEYYASVFRVDFGNPDLPAIIRQWIGWQTDQAISMDVATASGESMKLVNAVNYQAQWTGGFRTEDNITDVFHSADGQDITCQYMTGHWNGTYYRGQGFLRASLSLTDNASMIVVLPDQGVTIRELLSSEQYTREMFGRIDELESYGGIYWKIPKFQTATTADLGPSLAGLGLTGAFDVSRADFTGITGESLSLSGVIQSTVFSVNENGVGPFSENGEAGFAGLYSGEPVLQMNLDRPFLYAVTGYMGAPLYIGVCNRPAVNNP